MTHTPQHRTRPRYLSPASLAVGIALAIGWTASLAAIVAASLA